MLLAQIRICYGGSPFRPDGCGGDCIGDMVGGSRKDRNEYTCLAKTLLRALELYDPLFQLMVAFVYCSAHPEQHSTLIYSIIKNHIRTYTHKAG